jgi:FtsZ-interacting cell division protein ZipA
VDTIWIIVITVIVVVALVGFGLWLWRNRSRAADLPDRFGPEYDRTVERTGDEDVAKRELQERVERHEAFEIRELDDAERRRFIVDWQDLQRQFVDEPERAVERADLLIQDAMRTRGYPVEDFEQRARDLSVDHPEVVEHYRAGRSALEDGDRDRTEGDREAMLHFRTLFEHLIGAPIEPKGITRPEEQT